MRNLSKEERLFRLSKIKKEIILYVLDVFKNKYDIKEINKEYDDESNCWHFGGMSRDEFIINRWGQYGKTIEKYWTTVKI